MIAYQTAGGNPAGSTCAPKPPVRPWAQLPHDLAADPRLTPTDTRLLLALVYFARASDRCWPGNKALAARIGRSVDTVQRRLAHLEALGIVQRRPAPTRVGRAIFLLWRCGGDPEPMRQLDTAPVHPDGYELPERENYVGTLGNATLPSVFPEEEQTSLSQETSPITPAIAAIPPMALASPLALADLPAAPILPPPAPIAPEGSQAPETASPGRPLEAPARPVAASPVNPPIASPQASPAKPQAEESLPPPSDAEVARKREELTSPVAWKRALARAWLAGRKLIEDAPPEPEYRQPVPYSHGCAPTRQPGIVPVTGKLTRPTEPGGNMSVPDRLNAAPRVPDPRTGVKLLGSLASDPDPAIVDRVADWLTAAFRESDATTSRATWRGLATAARHGLRPGVSVATLIEGLELACKPSSRNRGAVMLWHVKRAIARVVVN